MIELVTSPLEAIELEEKFGAHNYSPLPVVLCRGEGVFLWDLEGKRYFDFLSAYSAINQGHCHPRLIQKLISQAKELTLTSRAFYNDKLGIAEKYLCETFNYQKALLMNSGAEANETAIKLARKWGYTKKNIPVNSAEIIVVRGNFHGRTTGVISASVDPKSIEGFGPLMPGFKVIEYDNEEELENEIHNPNVCGVWIEPIQGEAGIYVPKDGYLKRVETLCHQYNVLLMMDEIQTGLGRTGKMLASDYENVRPDILILGKALSGGVLPVSCVLADDMIMLVIKPGEHGSTFGGNPLAATICMEAIQIIIDERLIDNAFHLGKMFRERMNSLKKKSEFISNVRGKGLLNALTISETPGSKTANDLCVSLAKNGLLCKPTHGNIVRMAPPLVITEEQMDECCSIIERCVLELS